MRRAQCQNVLKRSKARQRPLCCVCIKTRSQQSSLPRDSNYCMTWKIWHTRERPLWIVIPVQFYYYVVKLRFYMIERIKLLEKLKTSQALSSTTQDLWWRHFSLTTTLARDYPQHIALPPLVSMKTRSFFDFYLYQMSIWSKYVPSLLANLQCLAVGNCYLSVL